jgi:hypothetical protein
LGRNGYKNSTPEPEAVSAPPEKPLLKPLLQCPESGYASLEEGYSEETGERLKEENKKLKAEKLCRICLSSETQILFLPCQHLVACKACADADLKTCPACSADIVTAVAVYKS